MNDGKLSLTEKIEAPKHQSILLSLLINIALLIILAGPWIWASMSSTHVENPLGYIQATFHALYSREKASWYAFRHGEEAPEHKESDAAKSVP